MLDKALPDFNKSLEIKPGYVDALVNRGSVYRMQNLPRLAIIDYNKALSIDSNSVLAISDRGNAYFTLGILDGVTEWAWFFVGASGAGAVYSQTDEATVFEGLVALGLVERGRQSQSRRFRVHPLGAHPGGHLGIRRLW